MFFIEAEIIFFTILISNTYELDKKPLWRHKS